MADFSKFQELLKTEDITDQYDVTDIQTNSIWGGLSYLLFFLPFIVCPNSKYAKYHANQGLILLILAVVLGILAMIVDIIPILGGIIALLLRLVVVAFIVLGIFNGLNGKVKALPIVGNLITFFE